MARTDWSGDVALAAYDDGREDGYEAALRSAAGTPPPARGGGPGGQQAIPEYLLQRGFRPGPERTWYDRRDGNRLTRVVHGGAEPSRLVALTPSGACVHSTTFSAGTPRAVIIAAVEAALSPGGAPDARDRADPGAGAVATDRDTGIFLASEAMSGRDVLAECRAADGRREISDACARAIARMHAASLSPAVAAFIARGEWPPDDPGYPDGPGALDGGTRLYRQVFPEDRASLSGDLQLAARMLGSYLLNCRPARHAAGPDSTVPAGDM